MTKNLPIDLDDFDLLTALKTAPFVRSTAAEQNALYNSQEQRDARWIQQQSESVYMSCAETCWTNGWTTFPQDKYDRKSSGGLTWSLWQTRRPTLKEVRHLAVVEQKSNVAMITGKTSGDTIIVDGDVNDPIVAEKIRQISEEVFGHSPFLRFSNMPRFAFIYRHDPADPIRKRVIQLASGGAVEILGVSAEGKGLPFTVLGRHYRTNEWFRWPEKSPLNASPDCAPVVSNEQLDEFVARLDAEIGLYKPKAGPQQIIEPGRWTGKFLVPAAPKHAPGVSYNPTTGKAYNGRQGLVSTRCYSWYVNNSGAKADELASAIYAELAEVISFDGRWTREFLSSQIKGHVRRLAGKEDRGHLRTRTISNGEDGTVLSTTSLTPIASADLDIVALAGTTRAEIKGIVSRTACDPAEKLARALMDDAVRKVETDRVAMEVVEDMQAWIDAVWEADDAYLSPVRLQVAPTGAGKTSTFLRLLVNQVINRGRLGGPIVMLTPSYLNIEENESKVETYADEADLIGLNVIRYTGKIVGGCLVSDQLEALYAANIGTGGMCEAEVEDMHGDTTTERCVHYDTCPVIAMKLAAQTADLILMPTAFLDLEMPAALKKAIRAVVIDEKCWTQLIHTREIPLSTLTVPRSAPYVTQKEAAVGLKSEDLIAARDIASAVAITALREGRDAAADLNVYSVKTSGGKVVSGMELADQARKVAVRASDCRNLIKPNLTDIAVAEISKRPQALNAWAEARFWALVIERIDALQSLTSARSAKGDRDMRIQLLDSDSDQPLIRMAWRTETKLVGKPTMMLDASASPEIVRKLWGGREVVVREIHASLHMRVVWAPSATFSDTSIMPSSHEYGLSALNAARGLCSIRGVIDTLAGLFGFGRVLVGSTKKVRTAINTAWSHPDNVDTAHFGAVAGLDFAKYHSAALCVGRQELRVRDIDSIVAGLTYDDETPELPTDRLGTGVDADGKEIRPTMAASTVRMRDGSDVTVLVPAYSGPWARIVQRQNREENTRQMIGRLRPVYRLGEPPVVVLLSSVIPNDLIVDEIVHAGDLTRNSALWSSVRRVGALDSMLASQACHDLSPLSQTNAAVRDIRENGMEARVAKGLAQVRVVGKDGVAQELYVPMYRDPEAAAATAYQCHGRQWRSVEVVAVGSTATPAQPRPTDAKFEAVVGTPYARRQEEEKLRAEMRCLIIDEPNYFIVRKKLSEQMSHLVPAGADGDMAKELTTLDVRIALKRQGRAARP